jgi:hypothetical protein
MFELLLLDLREDIDEHKPCYFCGFKNSAVNSEQKDDRIGCKKCDT